MEGGRGGGGCQKDVCTKNFMASSMLINVLCCHPLKETTMLNDDFQKLDYINYTHGQNPSSTRHLNIPLMYYFYFFVYFLKANSPLRPPHKPEQNQIPSKADYAC